MAAAVAAIDALGITGESLMGTTPLNKATAFRFRLLIRQANTHSRAAGTLVLRQLIKTTSPFQPNADLFIVGEILLAASASGSTAIVQQLLALPLLNQRAVISESAQLAVDFGHFNLLPVFCRVNPSIANETVRSTLLCGPLWALQFLVTEYPNCLTELHDRLVMHSATEMRRNAALVWLFETTSLRDDYCCREMQDNCVWTGNAELLAFLHSNGIGRSIDPCQLSSPLKNGYIDILEYIQKKMPKLKWPQSVMHWAILGGQLEAAKWLWVNNRCSSVSSAMWHAVFYGKVDIVKWLHDDVGARFPNNVLGVAIEMGHVHLAAYLLQCGVQCTMDNVLEAAKQGRFEIVKMIHDVYLHFNWTGVAAVASHRGHKDISDWLVQQRQNDKWTDPAWGADIADELPDEQ
eukprot:jgi/Hompol1/4771/HPOL_003871-RA